MRYKKPGIISILKHYADHLFNSKYSNEDKSEWDISFENNYWDNNLSNNNFQELHAKLKYLNYFEIISSNNIDLNSHIVADYGGGPYGGVLPLVYGTEKYLIDLIDTDKEFLAKNNIKHIKSSFTNSINLEKKFDVIFCCEALDHLPNMILFEDAVKEMIFQLKESGLLFFEMPIRFNPINGHPISLKDYSRNIIVKMFKKYSLEPVHRVNIGPSFGSPYSFICVFKKM
jgi:2-polyprenyl-3-methyl-5-hydroxy-6-metoxy-1,4-benzoquinol methylase